MMYIDGVLGTSTSTASVPVHFQLEWFEFPARPRKSGNYLVGHLGHQKVIYFIAPSDNPHAIRSGWQAIDPRSFGATHWAYIGDAPTPKNKRIGLRPLTRGTSIIFTDRNYKNFYYNGIDVWKPKYGLFPVSGHYETKYDKDTILIEPGDKGKVLYSESDPYTYYIKVKNNNQTGFVIYDGPVYGFRPEDAQDFYYYDQQKSKRKLEDYTDNHLLPKELRV